MTDIPSIPLSELPAFIEKMIVSFGQKPDTRAMAIKTVLHTCVKTFQGIVAASPDGQMQAAISQLQANISSQGFAILELQTRLAQNADYIAPSNAIPDLPETVVLSNVLALALQTNQTVNKMLAAERKHKIINP